jgi:sortase A
MMSRRRPPSGDAETTQRESAAAPGPAAAPARRFRRVGNLLLIAGGLLLAYPFWSAAYAHVQQARLTADYERAGTELALITEGVVQEAPSAVSDAELVRRLAVAFDRRLKPGDPIGHLRIPAISLNRVVRQGAGETAALDPDNDRALLRGGPVHYAVTPLPGAGEPFAVSGHRTTYGAPFYRLDRLRRGDVILVDTPYAELRYAVVKKTEVKPTDVSVLLDRGYGLVLTTCTPPYSASRRLVVWASLESATPRRTSSFGR